MNAFETWVSGWIDVACGLMAIITFGFYRPSWDFDFTGWVILRKMHRG